MTNPNFTVEPYLSVVIPIFNEEDSIPRLYRKILDGIRGNDFPFEIIFVDDGSSDRSFEILRQLNRTDSRVRVVQFRKNYGQTAAMAAGFDYAKGEVIISMDGDLQNDPADIPRILQKLNEGFDVVCGWRKTRKDKLFSRRIPSMVANWIIGKITGVPIHDNGCSLKAFRASVIKSVSLYGEMHRFIPAMSLLAGARVAEMVVNHHSRKFGASKYGIGRVWRVVLDIFTVKMITGFVQSPALWFGILAIPFLTLGFLVFGIMLWGVVGEWNTTGVVISLTVMLFFLIAFHLVAMGLIGELSVKTGINIENQNFKEWDRG